MAPASVRLQDCPKPSTARLKNPASDQRPAQQTLCRVAAHSGDASTGAILGPFGVRVFGVRVLGL